MKPLLKIRSLKTYFFKKEGTLRAVDGVDLEINPGETLALVGESGSGKTVTVLSIFRLVPPPGRIVAGAIEFRGSNLLTLPEKQMSSIRGKEIGFVLQDALSALNPVMRVGEQIAEIFRHHFSVNRAGAKHRTLELMKKVQLPNGEQLYHAYPHQLSGGLRQRVLIAIALACQPALVVADEPTTALDVSIQSQILSLLQELKEEFKISLLLITHDLGIVAQMADRVAVMYAGKIVEQATTEQLFTHPLHPYTEALLNSIPRINFSSNGQRQGFAPLPGKVPDLMNLPSGCTFHPRCAMAEDACRSKIPEDIFLDDNRCVKCLKRAIGYDETIQSSA
ncbi:MAG: ABC transporter ATP-binding protein [bacterium]